MCEHVICLHVCVCVCVWGVCVYLGDVCVCVHACMCACVCLGGGCLCAGIAVQIQ